MNQNGLYKKEIFLSSDKNKLYAGESVREITFSTDPRDYGIVARGVPCQEACPARTNIPGYIRCIWEKRYGRAYELNRSYNILPGVLGRICSRPCEEKCRHGEPGNGEPVGICDLKRSAADFKSPMHRIMEGLYSPSGKKVALVGAGPAGLAAAHELTVLGHKAIIYESEDKPGGMLTYGIPEFRLPRSILDLEIENIIRLGVELKTGVFIGRDISIDDLMESHDAVILTTGCTSPRNMNIPGEDLEYVYNGLDFMKAVNAGETPYIGNSVTVIGGGFTAVDCARSAVRMGAEEVKINIRKTVEYMRIDEREKHETRFEKVRFYSLVEPSRIVGDNGRVTGIVFRRTKLEYSSKPPYRIAVPIENSEFEVPTDSVIAAIGQSPDPNGLSEILGKTELSRDGSYQTGMDRLFAAGDFVTGSTNVITAIAHGRNCAHEVDGYLIGTRRKNRMVRLEPFHTTDRERANDFIPRTAMNTLPLEERLVENSAEVEKGLTKEQAETESRRCYLCNLTYEIDVDRCIYCSACIDVAPKDCIKMIRDVEKTDSGALGNYVETNQWSEVLSIAIDNEQCIRCGKCYEVCPMDCITVTKFELIEHNLEA